MKATEEFPYPVSSIKIVTILPFSITMAYRFDRIPILLELRSFTNPTERVNPHYHLHSINHQKHAIQNNKASTTTLPFQRLHVG